MQIEELKKIALEKAKNGNATRRALAAQKALSDAVDKIEAKAKKRERICRKIREIALILSISAAISATLIIVLCALPVLVECIASHI